MWQINSLFVLNTKCYVWGKSNTTLSTTLLIFKHGGGCIMLWVYRITNFKVMTQVVSCEMKA
jgi:hypothetical protein